MQAHWISGSSLGAFFIARNSAQRYDRSPSGRGLSISFEAAGLPVFLDWDRELSQNKPCGPVFICGPSRSGTTLVTWVFKHQLGIVSAGETHYFSHLRLAHSHALDRPLTESELDEFETYFFETRWQTYLHKQIGKSDEHLRVAREPVRARCLELGGCADHYFRAYCEIYQELLGGETWGEKTPRHIFRIDEIFTVFPDATVVCMIRDPRSVVASFKDWGKDRSEKDVEVSDGESPAKEPQTKQRQRVQQVYHPITIATLCKGAFRAAQLAQTRHGADRVRIIRFEDLVCSPRDVLNELADWLGITAEIDPENMPVSNSSYKNSEGKPQKGMNTKAVDRWRKTLTPTEIWAVERFASGMLRDGGYEPAGVKISPFSMIGCYLRFFPSAVRGIFASRHRTGNLFVFVLRRVRMLFQS